MKFFDPYIHSDERSDEDLSNLAYFGTERVVTCANAPQRFERAEQLLGYFDALLTTEKRRLQDAGLEPFFALGVHPDAAPVRAFYSLWEELPQLLEQNDVVAIGEIGVVEGSARAYGLLEHQLRLAQQTGLPCIVRIPSRNAKAVLRQTLACVRRANLDPGRVLLTNVEPDQAGVLDEVQGFNLAIRLDPDLVRGDSWPEIRKRLGHKTTLLSTSLTAGPRDVLAVTRAVIALSDVGEDTQRVQQWCYGNAMALFLSRE